MITALVPMKGHSERIPNKNLQLFDGYPLCYWIIKTLTETELVEDIYVNTDSYDISSYIKKTFPHVGIIKRPDHICGDYVSVNEIISHDLSQIKESHFLQTHSTNPLLRSETINEAIKAYLNRPKYQDSLFTVSSHKSRFFDKDGNPINHNPSELIPTQNLPPLYEENSNLYIFSKESFKNNENRRIGKNPIMFKMEKLESIDIDYPSDFSIALAIKKYEFETLSLYQS